MVSAPVLDADAQRGSKKRNLQHTVPAKVEKAYDDSVKKDVPTEYDSMDGYEANVTSEATENATGKLTIVKTAVIIDAVTWNFIGQTCEYDAIAEAAARDCCEEDATEMNGAKCTYHSENMLSSAGSGQDCSMRCICMSGGSVNKAAEDVFIGCVKNIRR